MRGDKPNQPQILIEKKGLMWGTIIDTEGVIKGHIISTKWHTLMIVIMFLLMALGTVLSALVLINRFQMDNMQNQINVEHER